MCIIGKSVNERTCVSLSVFIFKEKNQGIEVTVGSVMSRCKNKQALATARNALVLHVHVNMCRSSIIIVGDT